MSAFLVSKKHIDVLVRARNFVRSNITSIEPDLSDNELGRMLWRENMLSLVARYNEPTDELEIAGYFYKPTDRHTVPAMLKALHCYEYQSCEHKGWANSRAKQFCQRLEAALIRKLPGYDDAPWGID